MQFIKEEQSKWQQKTPECLKMNSSYWQLSNTELLERDKNVHQQLFDFPESPPFYEGKTLPLFARRGNNDVISVIFKTEMMICIVLLKKKKI